MHRKNHSGCPRAAIRRSRLLAVGALAVAALAASGGVAPVAASLDLPSLGDPLAGRLVGRVHTGNITLPATRVYVYDVADESRRKATTDRFGRYAFQPLPAGIYRVIVHRPGFLPAVAELVRTTGESIQSLDFELVSRDRQPSEKAPASGEDDFWSVRQRIPADVLRQIRIAEAIADDRDRAFESAMQRERFEAELRTLSGIEDAGGDAGARVLGSQFDIRSRFGETRLTLHSDLREISRQAFNQGRQRLGDSQEFELDVNHRGSNVQITSRRHRYRPMEGATWDDWSPGPGAGLESWGLRLDQAAGGGASHFEARYTADNNFHHGFTDLYAGPSDPHSLALSAIDSPLSSTTLEIRGGYERQVTASTSLEAGLSYRERQAHDSGGFSSWNGGPHERFDLFSQGAWAIQPTVLLKYGIFSTLGDGSVSFTPRAGFVVELGSRWMAAVSASERVESEDLPFRDFLQAQYHDEDDDCTTSLEHCYRVELSRRLGDDDKRRAEFGITRRQFADTVRLYFSREIFERLESLLLLDGDEISEVHFGLRQRPSKNILTSISASAAEGGGGLLRHGDGREPLQNQVRYLVASIDTRFERSATGVLLAFRRVKQELSPLALVDERLAAAGPSSVLAVERVQLVLSQGLPWVTGHGAHEWALQLEAQLSRGHLPTDPSHDPNRLRRRVAAGIAVSF